MRTLLFFPLLLLSAPLSACEAKDNSQEIGVFRVRIEDAKYATEVAVVGPNKEFIYLKQVDIECTGTTYAKGILAISLGNAVGVTWQDGNPHVVDVFNKAGKYRVFVGDNLETELENSYNRIFNLVYQPNSSSKEINSDRGCIVDDKQLYKPG